jgi:nicotinamidase-related amidase
MEGDVGSNFSCTIKMLFLKSFSGASASGSWTSVLSPKGKTAWHPEVPDFESPFLMAKQNDLFVKGTPSAEFVPSIAKAGELVVYKQRVGAFSENHLDLLLRSQGIDHLVLFGIATSGIVLSTIRRAFDMNYRCVVLKDACADRDEEVHRVLTEKVFARQGLVTTVDAFIAEQGP